MARKQYFLIVDVETSIKDTVADFGAVICDRHGKIATQCAVLVQSVFGVESLFFDKGKPGIWSAAGVSKRMNKYNAMLQSGSRMLASVAAVNRWLEKAAGKYNPTLTAYNLPFDADKCQKTGIDLNPFAARFCLWAGEVSAPRRS